MVSETGLFLSGEPLPPPAFRLRPFGCVAVVVASKGRVDLEYRPCPEQAAWDTEREARG